MPMQGLGLECMSHWMIHGTYTYFKINTTLLNCYGWVVYVYDAAAVSAMVKGANSFILLAALGKPLFVVLQLTKICALKVAYSSAPEASERSNRYCR